MKINKRLALVLAVLSVISLLSACAEPLTATGEITLTDSDGKVFNIPKDPRVVCAYGSFAECWILSGGSLVGVTEDAISERGLDIPDSVTIVGTVKSVDLESVISLKPDLVILSSDLTAHRQIALQLADRGIAAALLRVDSFSDYELIMKQFCAVNGGDVRYKKHVSEVREDISRLRSRIPVDKPPKEVLIMRAYSSGIKVKSDNIAEDIAIDLGCLSLAQKYPSMLTDLSVEAIISSDPDVILILTMGDEAEAVKYMKSYFGDNPALSSLSAVRDERIYVLPKELFHYKPNNKWNESYEYLAKILYPEIFE